MDREEAEKAFIEPEDLWERFSEKIKAEVAVEGVARKVDKMDLSTEPAPEGTFKEWIGKLEARVQDLSKRREFLPQVIRQVVDKHFASLNKVKGLELWTESKIVNNSY